MTESRTKKKVTKKKVAKKAPTKKKEFSLNDLATDLKKFKYTVLDADTSLDDAPYRIPFRNKALQLITGGIIGGKFAEIAGISQSGKSFLLYELLAECQAMGGYCNLNDGERAFEAPYAKMVGLNMNDGTFIVSSISDMNQLFAFWLKLVKGIRAKKRKAPILLGHDSFPTLQTSMSLDNMGSGNALGYEAMQRNQAWSREIEKFVDVLDEYDATLVLLNQFTRNKDAGPYDFPYQSLCEEKMQYWATQRIRGMLRGKLGKTIKVNNKDKKIQTGVKSQWETIKNRAVKPFQKATTKIRYAKGMEVNSGLIGLLLDTEILKTGTSKFDPISGEELSKAKDILKLNPRFNNDLVLTFDKKNIATSDDELSNLIETVPTVLDPIWTGTYDDGEDEELPTNKEDEVKGVE